jgi:hypothetical protein
VSLLVLTLSASTSGSASTIGRADRRLTASSLAWTALANIENGFVPEPSGDLPKVQIDVIEAQGCPALGLSLVRASILTSSPKEALVYEMYVPSARVRGAVHAR